MRTLIIGIFWLILLGGIQMVGVAQNYAANTIDVSLKEKAHAVVRYQETTFDIKNIGEATTTIKGAVTILDEKGDIFSSVGVGYNKFTKVKDFEAQLYDATGEKIKRLKKADIENMSTNQGDKLIDDSFIKMAVLQHTSYPYTVAYTYQYVSTNMMFYPTWQAYPYNIEGTAVEKNTFIISTPTDLPFRYKAQNLAIEPAIAQENDRKVYKWEVSNLKPIEHEPYAPDLELILPQLYTAPTEFAVENYKGKINNWSDLGKFYYELNLNRQVLSPAFSANVLEQIKGITNPYQKVERLYAYLQEKTRYINVNLGIGGWQAMPANEVASKGYGDCKALTAYMSGMLQTAGIKSYAVLVKSGSDEADILPDFPSFQFNHVFLCVPMSKDTIWLECTSQHEPFGYLSDFTSDRHVLLVTEQGGKLIRTPQYTAKDNGQHRQVQVKVMDNCEANIHIKTVYSGLQQDLRASVINTMGTDERKKWVQKSISLSSADVQSVDLKQTKSKIPVVIEQIQVASKNICNKSGSRLFATLNLLNQFSSVPLANTTRKYAINLTQNYTDSDTIYFEFPKGYSIEYLPTPVKIESKFGIYEATTQALTDKIVYRRYVTMRKGLYPASDYTAWVDFRKKIAKADKNQVVLVQK